MVDLKTLSVVRIIVHTCSSLCLSCLQPTLPFIFFLSLSPSPSPSHPLPSFPLTLSLLSLSFSLSPSHFPSPSPAPSHPLTFLLPLLLPLTFSLSLSPSPSPSHPLPSFPLLLPLTLSLSFSLSPSLFSLLLSLPPYFHSYYSQCVFQSSGQELGVSLRVCFTGKLHFIQHSCLKTVQIQKGVTSNKSVLKITRCLESVPE